MKMVRPILLGTGLLLLWQLLVTVTAVPHYILPDPLRVMVAIFTHGPALLGHLRITLTEIVCGFLLGTGLGSLAAIIMTLSPLLKRWLLPILVISQAIPVFALAPVLVLWLGYGMASKIAMAVLIIFFPVASSFYYGMQRTEPDLLELARVMDAGTSATLRYIVIPGAMPAFASGVRVAIAVAPIGAVVGEWVGSSGGLGYFMLHANARMQVDVMFAALVLLSAVSLSLYFLVDYTMEKIVFWQP